MSREWSLIVGHWPGTLAWVVLVACVGLALVEATLPVFAGGRGVKRGRRELAGLLGGLALRVVAIAALVAMVFELGLRLETFSGTSRRVVVLVDHSASMDLADGPADAKPGSETTRRFDRARTLWTEGAAAQERWRRGGGARGGAGGGVDVEVRGFAEQITPLTRARAETLDLRADGPASDLTRALVELGESNAGEGAPLAGVVVISDGLVSASAGASKHLGELVDALGVPVTTIAAGGPSIRDVAVAELHVGEFAFVENVTEFSATLISQGFDRAPGGEQAEVSLLRNGEPVATERLLLGAQQQRHTVRFEVAPDRVGQFVYEIRVAPLADEASVANNRRAFIIKVLRDKVRVLHVAGRPDWDVRALRTLLKRDPNVELLSYYILRDWEDTARDDGTAPMSLIAFPTDELFREELGSFDLIVMHNFDATQHGDYLGNVADYVSEGGALVVIGGDLGVASGDLASPAFTALMPIDLRGATGLSREPFAPQLSEAGRRHPITAWLAESGHGDWSGLPELDSFNPAGYGRDAPGIGTTTLLTHPSQRSSGGEALPLLAVAEPGKGRVMTLSTGATWRLGFAPDLPLIDGARPYDLLWLGAVRWLLRDASAERLALEVDRPEHALGEAVGLSLRTLSPSYAAEPGVEVEWDVRSLAPEAEGEQAPLARGRVVTDGLGRASARVEGLPAGAYQAEAWRASATAGEAQAGEAAPELGQAARRVFLVGGGNRELARVDAAPGTALLRELAERSGGEFVEAVKGEGLPEALPMRALDELERRADGRRDVPVWDGWLAMLIAIGAFGGEWILRRRVGQR